jgi:hypothetical protein
MKQVQSTEFIGSEYCFHRGAKSKPLEAQW